jgi:hypothetical protein
MGRRPRSSVRDNPDGAAVKVLDARDVRGDHVGGRNLVDSQQRPLDEGVEQPGRSDPRSR